MGKTENKFINLVDRLSLLIVSVMLLSGATCNRNPQEIPVTKPKAIRTPDVHIHDSCSSDDDAAWSSAGWIAYSHWDNDPEDPDENGIYIIRPDGTGKRMLYPGVYYNWLEWSPDGQWLLFRHKSMLIKISSDAKQVDTVLFKGMYPHPKWSPDGTKISFHWNGGDSTGIWVMNADGNNHHKLITRGLQQDWPYRDSIIYVNFTGDYPVGTICMADTNGNMERIIYEHKNKFRGDVMYPQLNINTKVILFYPQIPGELNNIWTINIDGSDLKRLTYSGKVGNPAFSPDGTKIIYTCHEERNRYLESRLWIMNIDGTAKKQLTFKPN